MSSADDIAKLRSEIRAHERRYYIDNAPSIADEEFDRLMKQLAALEAQHPKLRTADSPTLRVGGGVATEFTPVAHGAPMLSLDNSYNADDIRAWDARVKKSLGRAATSYAVEAKIDGVSLALTYVNGLLTRAATRGDGKTGEDVTPNARTIKSIPLRLNTKKPPQEIELRGEVYLRKDDFAKINAGLQELGKPSFVNPRNCTSGSLRQKDSQVTASRPLRFFVHSFGRLTGAPEFASFSDFLQTCRDFGFAPTEVRKDCADIEEMITYYESFRDQQYELPYEIDGLVAKVDARDEQRALGNTNKSPRWAMAFKYPGRQATTKLAGVEFSVGRTGTITPVAKLDPVFLSGVTISSASLHNFEEIERLDVRVGDTVVIERAGEVIPKVIQVVLEKRSGKTKKLQPPKSCPVCSATVIKDEEFVAFRCSNEFCPAQLRRKLLHFASRGGLDIEGFGEAVVEQIADSGRVKTIADIYTLNKDDLLQLELFADKKAEKLLAQIAASKEKPLSRLLFALGIPNIGEKTARDLADHFLTLEQLMQCPAADLENVVDIGPIVAQSVREFFSNKAAAATVKKLIAHGLRTDEPRSETPKDSALAGKTFVFTGELSSMSRPEAEAKIRMLGAKPVGSVSKKTAFVVVGANPGSKATKAAKLGVTTLSEKEFLKLLS
jgi:DNA ligase (NAD+)